MNKLFAILLALAAFGVVLTGCQSGDGEDSANGAPAATADSDEN